MKPVLSAIIKLCLVCLFFSCNTAPRDVIIRGNIAGLTSKYVYLYNTYPVGSPAIDSALVTNGSFEFKLHADTIIQPRLIDLGYSTAKNKRNLFGIEAPYSNKKSYYASFIMEPGITTLNGSISKWGVRATINSGKQNEFYFKHLNLPFVTYGVLPEKNKPFAKRLKKLATENPDAYWLLFTLDNFKFALFKADLEAIYQTFGSNLKQSYEGKKLKFFIDNKEDNPDHFTSLQMVDTAGHKVPLIDPSKKLSMVIFWASWCGPCRQEIPSLKALNTTIKNNDLKMVSVSIDEKKDYWMKALRQEQMPWQQLTIPAELRDIATVKYNLGYIPQIYLVNNQNKIINKIDGFDETNTEKLRVFINDYLAKN